MRFISWNVNGLRACAGKDGENIENGIIGFQTAFNTLDADFFCLQETKMQAGQFDLAFPGYQSYWNYAEKKATLAQPSTLSIRQSAYPTDSETRKKYIITKVE